jgi:hypothetical protein
MTIWDELQLSQIDPRHDLMIDEAIARGRILERIAKTYRIDYDSGAGCDCDGCDAIRELDALAEGE